MTHYTEFENLHKGQPGILICNGPSLADVPLNFLKKHWNFGSNSIYTLKGLLVNYYAIEGAGHLKNEAERNARRPYVEEVGSFGGYSFVNKRYVEYFQDLPNVMAIDYKDPAGMNMLGWSYDPLQRHATGHCVTYFILQAIFYMGFDPVLIVGMDHRFIENRWHYYKDEEAPEFHSMAKERFDRWAPQAEGAYRAAASVYEKHNRTILNLTPGTATDAFPTDSLSRWI